MYKKGPICNLITSAITALCFSEIRFKIKIFKGRKNAECLSMYIINTIPHGKCFVRYLRTRCFCIRNQLTRSLRSLVRFLIRQQLVRKYRTPALSMKHSLFLTCVRVFFCYKQCRGARSDGNKLSREIWLIYAKLI